MERRCIPKSATGVRQGATCAGSDLARLLRSPPSNERSNAGFATKKAIMSALTHWNPFRSIEGREDAFQDLVREFFGQANGQDLVPAVEVSESDGDVTVKMAVPGVEKDQISISVDDHTSNVRGESRKESEEKKKNYYRQEIRYGAFARAVRLPTEVDAAKTAAELKNGMLKITLPKCKTPKAQPIKVNAA